jgi:beta-glucanase (GH16 family)
MNKSIAAIILIFLSCNLFAQEVENGFDYSKWKLTWEDDFNYQNEDLDENWNSANHPSKNLYCSRWRENVDVVDGVMHLNIRKEKRGGQDWTAGSIWTKKKFKYGYFECRYRYAAGEATNNSFWLMTREAGEPKEGKRFEIDINEGHFPNEVSTNIHQWSDFTISETGRKKHYSSHKSFAFGTKPDYSIQLEIPVDTKKVRFISDNPSKFNLGEFRIYGVNQEGNYPEVLSETADKDIEGLVNYAISKDVTITTSGSYEDNDTSHNLVDGNPYSSWITQNEGQKWVEFEWNREITVGCIQFVNGWKDHDNWRKLISNYKVQYLKNGEWKDISVLDVAENYNFADDFHTYGFEWSEKELVFYFDGKEIRREKNDFCYSEVPVFLSLAIIKWHGTLRDSLDGTSMKVDYVKYYQKK